MDLDGGQHFVGRLWEHSRKGRDSASFEYDTTWLKREDRFSLQPALPLTAGAFHTGQGKALFGAVGDSAPDRWGRVLIRRDASRRSRDQGEPARTLREMDYLLAVNDEARQGAIRFSETQGGPFLAGGDSTPIPPLILLSKLLSATENVLSHQESEEDLRLLLAPGSSLGGARPKASVKDRDGHLLVAKFPRKDDEFSCVAWEAVALSLAGHANIRTPSWRIETISGKQVILLRRFDRKNKERIPFLSAMSMIDAKDNETRSYLEIADAIRQYGADPKADMMELWRRIVFSILISNTDDHLRNHGFVYCGQGGWRLSPVYDVNPTPVEIKPRILTTNIDLDDGTASLDLARSVAFEFGVKADKANSIIREAGRAVSSWRTAAKDLDIPPAEIERMSSAFENNDLRVATK